LKAIHSLSVAYVVSGHTPYDRLLFDQIRELERRRVRAHVLVLKGSGGQVLPSPPATSPLSMEKRQSVESISRPWLARTAAWIADEAERHQVSHLHAFASIRAVAAAAEAARLSRIGFSCSIGDEQVWTHRYAAVLSEHLSEARFILVPWHADALLVSRLNEMLADRLQVIPPGIDLRPLSFNRVRPAPTGRILGLVNDSAVATVRQLINILPLLDVGGNRATVALAWPSKRVAALHRLVKGRDLVRRVIPVQPAHVVESPTLPGAYDAVVWIDGARQRGFDPTLTGVLHAMAMGVPVVHVTTQYQEVIEDGRSGFVVSPSAPDRLVDALRTALWNDSVRRRIARAARRRVDREFNMLAGCERLRRLFAESVALTTSAGGATATSTPPT
jgi:glycosyltransferase involved in cell wall biosynthesis